MAVFATRTSWAGKVLLWSWAVAVAASTILTHQHHLLDVATGWMLGAIAATVIFNRFNSNS